MIRHLASVVLGVAALAVAAPAFSQDPSSAAPMAETKGPTTANLDKMDRNFLHEAATGGMLEVRLGQLAVAQAQSDDVKKFGQMMIDDHSAANAKLTTLAQQKNVKVPTELDKTHQAQVDKLSKQKGAAFDKAYMRMMVDDHKKDVAAFETQAKEGKDADVKSFAQSTLPTLRTHLDRAQEIHRAMSQHASR